MPNDIIIKSGTSGDCMYFLASGTVWISTPSGKEVGISQSNELLNLIVLLGVSSTRW